MKLHLPYVKMNAKLNKEKKRDMNNLLGTIEAVLVVVYSPCFLN